MDQRLIAIIVLFGFRFVLLAIPILDNLWIWAMRRFFHCCNGSDGQPDPNSVEGGRQQVIELHPMAIEGGSTRRQLYNSESESGIVILFLLQAAF